MQNMSLKAFWASRRWYGMSKATASLQPRAFEILFRPRKFVINHVRRLIEQCGGRDFWTVYYRNSPEKLKEQGGRLPEFDRYIRQIPTSAKRILWQTSNPQGFAKMLEFSASSSRQYCHTNFTRHLHDVWGGRNSSFNDESGIIGAVNGEAARNGVGCVTASSSMWSWFITVGTTQKVIIV